MAREQRFSRSHAEAELRWYFGTGASTAVGDMGLKSAMGAQLDATREQRVGTTRSVNPDRAERQMARAARAVSVCRNVERALARLSPVQQTVLLYAFGAKDAAPGTSRVVVLTGPARAEAARVIREREGRTATQGDVLQVVLEAALTKARWLEIARAAASALRVQTLVAYREARCIEHDERTWIRWDGGRS